LTKMTNHRTCPWVSWTWHLGSSSNSPRFDDPKC
jgi:hypothetical protein